MNAAGRAEETFDNHAILRDMDQKDGSHEAKKDGCNRCYCLPEKASSGRFLKIRTNIMGGQIHGQSILEIASYDHFRMFCESTTMNMMN
jgi:hypothetical protein